MRHLVFLLTLNIRVFHSSPPISLCLLLVLSECHRGSHTSYVQNPLKSNNSPNLPSSGELSTVTSVNRRSFYEKNSNYRFVEQSVQRVLGRDVYSEREKIAWSIVVATKGIVGFIDELINSDEYLEAFGDDILPYQRRRILPSQSIGEVPFNIKSPRYEAYHRAQLGFPQIIWQNQVRGYIPADRTPRAGDPALFLNLARSLKTPPAAPRVISTQNLDYEKLVPYRKN